MNVALLQKVKAHILEEPGRFFMSDYMFRAKPGVRVALDGIYRKMPDCGTAACIGGWAVLLSDPQVCGISGPNARAALGLDHLQSTFLFPVVNWPERYRQRWNKAASLKVRAAVAAARIDHFIKTEGRE